MLLVEDSLCVCCTCPTFEEVYIETQHLFYFGGINASKATHLFYGWIDSVWVLSDSYFYVHLLHEVTFSEQSTLIIGNKT